MSINYKYIDFIKENIGSNFKTQLISSANVHEVYRISSDSRNDMFLKIRLDHYRKTPNLPLDPADIAYEVTVVNLLNKQFKNYFPKVVAFSQELNAFLMSSVMIDEINLEHLLAKNIFTKVHSQILADTLRNIHGELKNIQINLRGLSEKEYYERNLFYKIDSLGYSALNGLTDKLLSEERQLILGDVSPKNIGVDKNGSYYCDFDNAHNGNILFEVGFLAGHLVLYSLNSNFDLVEEFIKRYFSRNNELTDNQKDILIRVILSTCIYRLDNKWIQYNLPDQVNKNKSEILKKIIFLLSKNSLNDIEYLKLLV